MKEHTNTIEFSTLQGNSTEVGSTVVERVWIK